MFEFDIEFVFIEFEFIAEFEFIIEFEFILFEFAIELVLLFAIPPHAEIAATVPARVIVKNVLFMCCLPK